MHGVRELLEQIIDRVVHPLVADQVVVVEHQDHPPLEQSEVVQ